MNLSRRTDYAVRAAIDLALQGQDGLVQLREIAARQAIPEKYLEQLLRALKTAGVVVAMRGSRGGYQLARPADQITLLAVFEAVEGPIMGEETLDDSQSAAAVVQECWDQMTAGLKAQFARVSVAELAARYRGRLDQGQHWVI